MILESRYTPLYGLRMVSAGLVDTDEVDLLGAFRITQAEGTTQISSVCVDETLVTVTRHYRYSEVLAGEDLILCDSAEEARRVGSLLNAKYLVR